MKYLDVPQSGSQASLTYSRNRYGQYIRNRSSPVQPRTTHQLAIRAKHTQNAQAWKSLTMAQRLAWDSLGQQIQRTDSLGQVYHLTGFQAYCMVNNNLRIAGEAPVSTPPEFFVVPHLDSISLTLTPTSFSLTFAPTPLGTGRRLFVFASPQRSPGRSFEHDLRLIHVSALAPTSPLALLTPYTARFGAPVAGLRIFVKVVVYEKGFTSNPLFTSAVVAS